MYPNHLGVEICYSSIHGQESLQKLETREMGNHAAMWSQLPSESLPWQSISSSTLEWIQERLTKLKDILERNSERSGLLLRKLLGPLRLEPARAGDNIRLFYKATTSLNTLALVDPLMEGEGGDGGSNSLQWWSRWDCFGLFEENARKPLNLRTYYHLLILALSVRSLSEPFGPHNLPEVGNSWQQ